jgi:serine-type D-Ala-D-Ala carboxypeptidase/endopeptidase (penicillin-binding protein 4)
VAVRPLPANARPRVARRALAVAVVLAIAGATCIALAARADTEPAVTSASAFVSSPQLATPLWSPRRVPALFGAAVAASKLRGELTDALGPINGCVTVNGPTGSVARIQPETPFAGASTQKLLVAAAALAVLGAHHHFDTRAVSDADLHDGTLNGDLTIVGGGDPVLSTASAPSAVQAPSTRLSDLADAIVRAGVRRITGALVADDTRYDRERALPTWDPTDVSSGQIGALGALIVNGGRGEDAHASPDPALATVQELATMLEARGVTIADGASDPGHAALGSAHEIASVASPPLDQIVAQMLTISDNETAELLTRELGHVRAGESTTVAGTRAIPAALSRLGVPTAGVALVDGSGLSATGRVTCAALLGVIALGSQPRFAGLIEGLPIAAQTGTLAERFVGTSLAGRLRAKTGHITGVSGLAGLIPSAVAEAPGKDHDSYRFASVANGDFSTMEGEGLEDQIAGLIGTYVDEPSAPNPIPAPG